MMKDVKVPPALALKHAADAELERGAGGHPQGSFRIWDMQNGRVGPPLRGAY